MYKRQLQDLGTHAESGEQAAGVADLLLCRLALEGEQLPTCLLYTSDAADERSSVDLGGRRIIKKKHSDKRGRTETTEDKRK